VNTLIYVDSYWLTLMKTKNSEKGVGSGDQESGEGLCH